MVRRSQRGDQTGLGDTASRVRAASSSTNGGDTEAMSIEPLALPTAYEWQRHGISDRTELHAGQQSRVFASHESGVAVAVKLTDGRLADAALLEKRMRVVESLASRHRRVVGPHRFGGRLVRPVGGWLMTGTAMVRGEAVDSTWPGMAELMGATLADLHAKMAELPLQELPAVAALVDVGHDATWSETQLLHGDFSDQNLISTADGLSVFDFDDCGYGPIEYDLANSLYMVHFDAEVNDRADEYEAFRPSFLAGYTAARDRQIAHDVVEEMMERRISALGRWLDDLSTAPIGIRTSSAEWQDPLRAFVRSHQS
jgi:Ser/Thr protein kinase RdoA (MazF antagonist)